MGRMHSQQHHIEAIRQLWNCETVLENGACKGTPSFQQRPTDFIFCHPMVDGNPFQLSPLLDQWRSGLVAEQSILELWWWCRAQPQMIIMGQPVPSTVPHFFIFFFIFHSLFSILYRLMYYLSSLLMNRNPHAFARVPVPTQVNKSDTFILTQMHVIPSVQLCALSYHSLNWYPKVAVPLTLQKNFIPFIFPCYPFPKSLPNFLLVSST